MSTRFDVVVVGAGPAGSAAALTLARAGHRVALVERGPYAGSKNMYGGVIYGRVLDSLIPRWWEEIPFQRWVVRRSTMVLSDERSLSVDFRMPAWGAPPHNGCTALRPDFDSWLAGRAEAEGATLITSTTVTAVRRDAAGRVTGVVTDREAGELETSIVVACDGVNSLIARQAGLYPRFSSHHMTLGVKEVLALPREEIDRRFSLSGDEGADYEILGAAGGVPGGAFLYTNAESVAIGLVLDVNGLAAAARRPEELIGELKSHPTIAPLVRGGELVEYSAHLIPAGGFDAMPELVADGLLIAGDAAALCLAAGIWLEGVNFAIGSGMAAGEAASEALATGDVAAAGLRGYRRRLEAGFVLGDHRRLRRAPVFEMSDRVQRLYPGLMCDLAEGLFTVTNPTPKRGALAIAREAARRRGLRLRAAARDGWTALRTYG